MNPTKTQKPQKTSLIDIINKAGLSNVTVQTMHGSVVGVAKRKNHAEITIDTDLQKGDSVMSEMNGFEGTHLGLIVWVPRAALKEDAV